MKKVENPVSFAFSIITVCRNEERTIKATIESVLSQNWSNIEYIIIDGASEDATVDIVRQYAEMDKRIRWFSEKDSGIFNAMNKGIRMASGDFLYFLNAGDMLHSNDVLRQVADVVVGMDIVIGGIAFKSDTGLVEHLYAIGNELRENLENGHCVCHQAIFASKRCLESGFDEQFQICADYDWLCRQVCAGKKIVKANIIIADYDAYGVSSQVQYLKLHLKEDFRVIEKNFPDLKLRYSEEIKQIIIRERKEQYQYKYMNQWLCLRQRGADFSSFFLRRGIYSVAIYGAHYMGQRLYDELKASRVVVRYAIDRNVSNKEWKIPVFSPDEDLESVDAVVITPVFDFLEIKAMLLEKLNCLMISIEEMLFYRYEM